MTTQRLHENGSLVESKAVGGVFPVRIISEGKGSSGVYRREMLKEQASAFNGAPSFMNHPLDPERPDQRDITTIAGKIVSEVKYDERDGTAGLYADLKVDDRWVGFVEDYKDVIGLSVYIEGSGRQEGGDYIVESFNGEDPYKSVDFVVAAGRGGRIERAMESYRAIESSVGHPAGNGTAPAGRQTEDKESDMEIKELGEKVETLVKSNDALTKSIEAFVGTATPILESLKPSEDSDAVDMAAIAEAARDLPEDIRKEVYATVEDKTQTEALAIVKARVDLVESIKKSLGENKAPVTPIGRATGEQGSGSEKFSLTKIGEKA